MEIETEFEYSTYREVILDRVASYITNEFENINCYFDHKESKFIIQGEEGVDVIGASKELNKILDYEPRTEL